MITIFIFRIEIVNFSFYMMLIIIFLCGIGSGGLYSMPSSIYGDIVMRVADGENVATYTGALTFSSNIANSLTQLLVGVLLDIIKFDSAMQVQTLQVQTGLALILFVGIQVTLIFACMIFASILKKNN